MVTGDHPATAEAVAREIGLGQGNPKVIEANQLDTLLQQGSAALMKVDVIARAVPSQKLSLVRGLQSAGEVVAVTGDGVNDVPALQAADIGIAMGQRGHPQRTRSCCHRAVRRQFSHDHSRDRRR